MDGYEVFVTVVDCGNFAAAAKRLGVTSSAVSKQISRLETQLGVQLLSRSTRSLALTEPGALCFEHACRIIQQRRDMEVQISNFQQNPTGVLKITGTPAFGEEYIIGIIAKFQKAYPNIQVELELTPENEDIVQRGIDIAIREGNLSDSNLLARRLTSYQLIACASPEYLENADPITRDKDVLDHQIVLLADKDITRWMGRQLGVQDGDFKHVILRLNQISSIRHALLEGMGISFIPEYLVRKDIQEGRLVEVPLKHKLPSRDVHAVYSSTQGAPRKVRVFIDYLIDYFSSDSEGLPQMHRGQNEAIPLASASSTDSASNHLRQGSGGELLRSQSVA